MHPGIQFALGLVTILTIVLILYFLWNQLPSLLTIGTAIAGLSYGRGTGHGMICSDDREEKDLLCYKKPEPGFTCEVTHCSKDCPPDWTGSETHLGCNKDDYWRGTGTIPTECPSSHPEKDASGDLCYPYCRTGYKGVGPVCWQNCPSGYTDTGALCTRPADTKGRDSKYSPSRVADIGPCDSGQRDDGTSCWEDWKCHTWECGRLRGAFGEDWGPKYCTECGGCGCIKKTVWDRYKCNADEVLINGRCYPKCDVKFGSKYDRSGQSEYCTEICPVDYKETGVSCYRAVHTISKDSYGRGAGVIKSGCTAGKTNEQGLCYTPCKDGYKGVLDRCWFKDCPDGYKDQGVFCSKPSYDRGVGTVKNTCPEGQEKDPGGLICYDKCKDGYKGVGPVCWKETFTADNEVNLANPSSILDL